MHATHMHTVHGNCYRTHARLECRGLARSSVYFEEKSMLWGVVGGFCPFSVLHASNYSIVSTLLVVDECTCLSWTVG